MIQRQITVITKLGAAAGEAGRPERADWTIDQGWEKLYDRRARRLEDAVRASDEIAPRPRLQGVREGDAQPADRRRSDPGLPKAERLC